MEEQRRKGPGPDRAATRLPELGEEARTEVGAAEAIAEIGPATGSAGTAPLLEAVAPASAPDAVVAPSAEEAEPAVSPNGHGPLVGLRGIEVVYTTHKGLFRKGYVRALNG